MEKEVTITDKNGEKITKGIDLWQDFWQAHYQILSIILLK